MRPGGRALKTGLAAVVALGSLLALASIFVTASRQAKRAEVRLGEEFKLGAGQSAAVAGASLEIEFVSVVEDSRCPRGVDCVWEGNARVRLRLKRPGAAPTEIELNTNLEPRRAAAFGHDVRLKELSPYPQANQPVDKKTYVAALEVHKT